MTGLPTLSVKLDDGTGTFPYDVSTYVVLRQAAKIQRGRADEFATVQPSTLNLTLDNKDGRFTLGSGTYGIHVDQRIRVTETVSGTTKDRFTGYVQSWPVEWPTGDDQIAHVAITATDLLSRLARDDLPDAVSAEVLVDDPEVLYRLNEPAGSTSAGDTSGNAHRPLLIKGDPSKPLAFGDDNGTPGGGTAVKFAPDTTASVGQYLQRALDASFDFTSGITLECVCYPTDPNDNGSELASIYAFGASLTVTIGSFWEPVGGLAWGDDYLSGGLAAIEDGSTDNTFAQNRWTHIAVTAIRTGTARIALEVFADGVSKGTKTLTSTDGITEPMPALTKLRVGQGGDATSPEFVGDIANVAVFPRVLTAAQIADHAGAATGFAGEYPNARITRIAGYVGLVSGDLALETGTAPLAGQTWADESPLDLMSAVEKAEGGVLFVNGSGQLVLQARTHRVGTATGAAVLAVTSADVNPDAAFVADTQFLYNIAKGSRVGGAAQTVIASASKATHGGYPNDQGELLVQTDDAVVDRLRWLTSNYAEPKLRLPTLAVDLMTSSTAIQQAAITAEIGDRVTVSNMPSQAPASTADVLLEGWTETLSDTEWTLEMNTVDAAGFRTWILEDAVYGLLDSTTILYY